MEGTELARLVTIKEDRPSSLTLRSAGSYSAGANLETLLTTPSSKLVSERRILVAILLSGLFLRLYLVLTTSYLWDEDREWIPLGKAISFLGEGRNLPWRSETHGALSAYVVKVSSLLFGENPLGYRVVFLVAGVVAIYGVAKLAWEWMGFEAAAFAATLLTFNEYHIALSSLAVPKGLSITCVAFSALHFGRYLQRSRSHNLYIAAALAGVGFLLYETTALILPAFFLTLIVTGRMRWLGRREVWVAAGIGFLVVLPDIVWNVLHWEKGYGLHTGRLAGIGLNPHFVLFFGRDFLMSVAGALGRYPNDPLEEYPSMNAAWGVLLLAATATALVKWRELPLIARFAVIYFWGVLLFFCLGKPGADRKQGIVHVDAEAWFWIDHVLVSASLLAGWWFSRLSGNWKRVAASLVLLICSYSTIRVVRDKLNIPSIQIAFSPSYVWPPDGRVVDVKAFVSACQLCRPELSLVDTKINRHDRNGLLFLSPSEVGASLGVDDRKFQIRAEAVPSRWLTYRFVYRVTDRGSEQVVPGIVTVWDANLPSPFWAHD